MKWLCKGCAKRCTAETDEDLSKQGKCLRWEMSLPDWVLVSPAKKSLEAMMEELLSLYPGTAWNISYRRTKDEGGEYVPHSFVVFGKMYYGKGESKDIFTPLYLDDKGQVVDSEDFTTYYEAADGGLETDLLCTVSNIYDEVMKRRKNK